MKNNILKFVLIVSLLLNISFLGTAAYTYYKQAHYLASPFIGRGGIPGMLFEELSLKPEQVKEFRQRAAVFHQGINTKRQEVDQLRVSLLTLMRADQPDSTTIEATIGKINMEQNEIQKMVVTHMLEFKSMLDKGQQKKFLDMIQGAMEQRGEAVCPP